MVASNMNVCPVCAERIEAAAVTCSHCGSAAPSLSDAPSVEPETDSEVLSRDPKGSRGVLTVAGILVVILVAYGAIRMVSGSQPQPYRPEGHSGAFNIFVKVES